MNWRRIADVLCRRPLPSDAERVTKDRQIADLERQVTEINQDLSDLAAGAHSRLAAYRRVRAARR